MRGAKSAVSQCCGRKFDPNTGTLGCRFRPKMTPEKCLLSVKHARILVDTLQQKALHEEFQENVLGQHEIWPWQKALYLLWKSTPSKSGCCLRTWGNLISTLLGVYSADLLGMKMKMAVEIKLKTLCMK